jgi:sucrose-6-phosphate hydrolase SacC (GH32 family)
VHWFRTDIRVERFLYFYQYFLWLLRIEGNSNNILEILLEVIFLVWNILRRRLFNTDDGNIRTRKLENPLDHLRIYIDHSSVEIFVNNGDAVFTSRVFPHYTEHHFEINTKAEVHIWNLRPAVVDNFII